MKTRHRTLLVTLFSLGLGVALAQPGGAGGDMGGGGPNFGGSVGRLFGDHKQFSAVLELEAHNGQAGDTTLPGRLSYSDGKSRFEMDMSMMKNSHMSSGAGNRLKTLGLARMIAISRPDQKLNYMIYPDLKAYYEIPAPEVETPEAISKYTLQATELGTETVDGHPCVRNKVVVTDEKGNPHEYIVWYATDLKQFPIKIDMTDGNAKVHMRFQDIKLAKPDVKLFEAPAGLTRYEDKSTLMQAELMKHVGPQGGMPPAQR